MLNGHFFSSPGETYLQVLSGATTYDAMSGDGSTLVKTYWSGSQSGIQTYTRSGDTITLDQTVYPTTAVTTAVNRVVISNDALTMALCSHSWSSNTGKVVIFAKTGGVWAEQGVYTGPVADSYFGCNAAFSSNGNVLVVTYDASPTGATGIVGSQIFTRSGTTWSLTTTQSASQGGSNGTTIDAVCLISADGKTVAYGQLGIPPSFYGRCDFLTESGGTWTIVNTNVQTYSQYYSMSGDATRIRLGGAVWNRSGGSYVAGAGEATDNDNKWYNNDKTYTITAEPSWDSISPAVTDQGRFTYTGKSGWVYGPNTGSYQLGKTIFSTNTSDYMLINGVLYKKAVTV